MNSFTFSLVLSRPFLAAAVIGLVTSLMLVAVVEPNAVYAPSTAELNAPDCKSPVSVLYLSSPRAALTACRGLTTPA